MRLFEPVCHTKAILLSLLVLIATNFISAADDKQLKDKAQKLKTLSSQPASVTRCFAPLQNIKLEQSKPPNGFSATQGNGVLGGQTFLSGSVQLRLENGYINAEALEIGGLNGDFSAEGNILLKNNLGEFTADRMRGNQKQQSSELRNSKFTLGINGANGQARRLSISDQEVAMEGLSFSTCPTGDKSWRLFADHIDIDNEKGWAEVENAILKIADVPILYLPWLKFPIDERRHTGLLPPAFGSSDRTGFDVSQPIYLNLAPNYDATLTPRYMSDRGTQLGGELRYLDTKQTAQVSMEVMEDRLADKSNRWSYQTNYDGFFGSDWRFTVDAAGVSDNNYFAELGNGLGIANRDQLKRQAALDFRNRNFNAQVSWLEFQPLVSSNEPYEQLPQTYLSWFDTSQDGRWQWELTSEYSQFSSSTERIEQAERLRNGIEVSRKWLSNWGFLTASARSFYHQYKQSSDAAMNLTENEREATFSANQFSVDSGLVFVRDLQSGSQTLEPRLKLLISDADQQASVGLYDTYQPLLSWQQVFADNRFSGGDRIGDTEQLSVGVTSRFLNMNNRQYLAFSVAQIRYYRDREVQLPNQPIATRRYSDIVAGVQWSPTASLTTNIDWVIDPYREETSQGKVDIHYEPNDDFMVKISHRFIDNQAGFREQADIGMAFPLSPRWQFISRWQYDLIDRTSFETMAGLEYQSCCWTMRVVSRRYLNARLDPNGGIIPDPDGQFNNDIQLQFVLRGLGQANSNEFARMLKNNLWSY